MLIRVYGSNSLTYLLTKSAP